MHVTSRSVEETRSIGAAEAKETQPGDIFALIGELGAGKTEFVRGFAACCSPDARVQSPSFTILKIYEAPLFPIYHFDFYRLSHSDELIEIGFADYIDSDGVCLIEWADKFPGVIPARAKTIRFSLSRPEKATAVPQSPSRIIELQQSGRY
ncbi:MAG: tRNA (adenosine(37)-N6)-threonylcarbamoyltransferase complex ATPase subunit type 1 TsaE [Chitinivibrionales bacterium]|nr:tRNA (adenosine(37)-N6)-threonylcarbamoyltransferase complex ATPase subunit type 1 TsaE [Chitinivibrionales bacterium]